MGQAYNFTAGNPAGKTYQFKFKLKLPRLTNDPIKMDPSEVGPDQTRPNPNPLVSDPIGPDPIKKSIKVQQDPMSRVRAQ